MKFVIAGTGRNGSTYIAEVLSAAGVPCGHEAVFSPLGVREPDGLLGDSSWAATPHLESTDLTVYHQVRHPLKVLASWAQIKDTEHGRIAWDALYDLIGVTSGARLVDVARYITTVHDIAERHAVRSWRVEDVDAALVCAIAADSGVRVSPECAATAIASVPTDTNDHGTKPLAWSDLPFLALRELGKVTRKWGYR